MKFLCDEMLEGLGRWLRGAGYDTKVITVSVQDREILDIALAEHRLLLTRDRHFLEMKDGIETVIHLNCNTMEDCIKELSRKLNIDWLFRPFSRCLTCNTPFIKPNEKTALEQVPEDILFTAKPLWYCPACQKVYWEGSHTDHMLKQLQEWSKNSS